MIDTIKLAYPLDRTLFLLLDNVAEKLQRLSPDGEILWEKSIVKGNVMPSHYSGLRISIRRANELYNILDEKQARQIGDLAFFEFSLQKWQSPSAYNNNNTRLSTDMIALKDWVESLGSALGYTFELDRFRLYRVDLSENYLLNSGNPHDYIRRMELCFSRHPTAELRLERSGSSVWQKSSWLGKKIYYKGQEFLDVERKKHNVFYTDKYLTGESEDHENYHATDKTIKPLSRPEITEIMKMIRFEIEFKRDYLARYKMTSINDLPKLVSRFDSEKQKYINIPLISRKEVVARLFISPSELYIIELVRLYGLKQGKDAYLQKHSLRSWYRHQRTLLTKGVSLSAIDNHYRYDEVEISAPETLPDYTLTPANYVDYYKLAA